MREIKSLWDFSSGKSKEHGAFGFEDLFQELVDDIFKVLGVFFLEKNILLFIYFVENINIA